MFASRLLLAALSSITLMAAPMTAVAAGASIGTLGVGGSGCPAGTVSAVLGSNQLSLKFSRYVATAGGARSLDRKACGIAIPFRVPSGMSVAIVGVQYAGRNKLPAGSTATLRTETFFAGGTGPVVAKSFAGPSTGSYRFTSTASAPVWSACGASFNLRINSSLIVRSPGGATASSSISSQDVAAGLVYLLKFRAC